MPSDRVKVPRSLATLDAVAEQATAAALGMVLAKTEQLVFGGMGSLHVLATCNGLPLSSTIWTWTAIVRVVGLPITHWAACWVDAP